MSLEKKIVLGSLVVSAVIFLVLSNAMAPAPAPAPMDSGEKPSAPRTLKDWEWEKYAEMKVKKVLLDPESARFDLFVISPKYSGNLLCGTVNAKNRFGGYNGFQSYMILDAVVYLQVMKPQSDSDYDSMRLFTKTWNEGCK